MLNYYTETLLGDLVADKKPSLRKENIQIKTRKLLMSSEQRTDHPTGKCSTSLKVFVITWVMRREKLNQLLRLNCGGVEKYPNCS